MTIRYSVRLGVLLALYVVIGACQARRTESFPTPSTRHILIEVENRYWQEMAIYVGSAEPLISIGLVPAMHSRAFVIPASYAGSGIAFRLMARAFPSREQLMSDPVAVGADGRVHWIIDNARRSSILVR